MKKTHQTLVGSPEIVRSLANSLRKDRAHYEIVRIDFKNYNSYWKGYRGIGLKVTNDVYNSLYK